MGGLAEPARDRNQRFWEQLAEVKRQHRDRDFLVEPVAAAPASAVAPRYVYEAGWLLCAPDRLADVRQRLGGRCGESRPAGPGLSKLQVDPDCHIPTEVDRLADLQRAGSRPAASPNHLVSIAPVNFCPADEPAPVPAVAQPWPAAVADGGAGVRVLVIDTGLIDDYLDRRGGSEDPPPHHWLAGSLGGDPNRLVEPDDPYQMVKQYAGHGTFVAGVLKAAAPGADVTVSNALVRGGAVLEDELGATLLSAVEQAGWPQIISLSAGATSHRSAPLLGLESFLDALAQHPETVLVAAAGNDGNDDNLFFPAAGAATHPGIVSVGALRRDQRGRACFSNFGRSVTVYAVGEHHHNAFLTGPYAYRHLREPACRYHQPALYPDCTCLADADYGGVVYFAGMARWSGTSFATPLVAGMIATHMTTIGERDARAAWRDLRDRRLERIADVDGELLAVLRRRSS